MEVMQAKRKVSVIRNYLDYLDEHLDNVWKSWNEFKEVDRLAQKDGCRSLLCDDFIYWTIEEDVKRHDISKLSMEELVPYAEWFCGPDKHYPQVEASFNKAVMHHLKANDHHWQTWTKNKYNYPNAQFIHLIHMVIDWMAMGLKFGDSAEEYYLRNAEKIKLPDWSKEILNTIFARLRKYG